MRIVNEVPGLNPASKNTMKNPLLSEQIFKLIKLLINFPFKFIWNSLKPAIDRQKHLKLQTNWDLKSNLIFIKYFAESMKFIYLFDRQGYFRSYCVRCSVTGVNCIDITCGLLKRINEIMETIFQQWHRTWSDPVAPKSFSCRPHRSGL
jgi:hypothetical protein